MKTGKNDIVIKLHLDTKKGIDAKKLIKVLDAIEKALYKSDFEDVNRYYKDSYDFKDSLVRDAVLERLRSYRHRRLRLYDSSSGSIVLLGVVTAVSGFILQKTIGQAFGDAYKDSQAYIKHKKLFQDIFDGKYKSVRRHLRNIFVEDFDQDDITVKDSDEGLNLIEIDFSQEESSSSTPIPSWDKVLEELHSK